MLVAMDEGGTRVVPQEALQPVLVIDLPSLRGVRHEEGTRRIGGIVLKGDVSPSSE